MNPDTDAEPFGAMLRQTMEFYDRQVSDSALRMWWATLSDRDMDQVRYGLQAHLQDPDRGRWPPKPGDIIHQIENRQIGQWLGADDAWSLALRAMDESETLVWDEQIAEAWSVALPIHEAGDEVGARMAFRDRYQQLVRDAARSGQTRRMTVSLGHDPDLRAARLEQAVEQGTISRTRADTLLPPPEDPEHSVAGLLTGQVSSAEVPDDVRANLASMKAMINGSPGEDTSDERSRHEQSERKREAAKERLSRLQGEEKRGHGAESAD